MFDDDDKEHPAKGVAVAVVTAALTTAATMLVTWAIDELREKYSPKKPEKPKDPPTGS